MYLPLQQQVCSLELAKRLEELGVKKENGRNHIDFYDSQFYWIESEQQKKPKLIDRKSAKQVLSTNKTITSAYTLAELGEMLKDYMEDKEDDGKRAPDDMPKPDRMGQLWEPDFLATVLIFCLENKLIEL